MPRVEGCWWPGPAIKAGPGLLILKMRTSSLFWGMFGFVFSGTLVAAAGAAPAVPGTPGDPWVNELLKSGSTGFVYAGSMVLAVRWLFVQLIAAKDNEVDRWKTVATQAMDAQKDSADSMKALTAALERLERGSEVRSAECARNVAQMLHAGVNRFEDRPQ